MATSQSTSVGSKLKQIGRHSIIYGLGSIAQSGAGFILLPILTAALSKKDFGVYSLIVLGSTIASAIFYFGMTSALPRSYFDYESSDYRRSIFTSAFVVMLIGALLQSSLAYCCGDKLSLLIVGSAEYGYQIVLAFIGAALTFINTFFFSYLRLLRKSLISVLFSITSLIAIIWLTFYFLEQFTDKISAPFIAIILCQGFIALIFIVIYGKSSFSLNINVKEAGKLLHFGISSIVASFGAMLIDGLDRFLIERYMSLGDVGAYSAAFRVSALINVLLVLPFTQIWSPMIMEYRNHENIKDLFSYALSFFVLSGGILIIASSLFAKELLPILIRSGQALDLIPIFLIGIIGMLVYGLANIFGAGLFYERKVHLLSIAYYGAAILKAVIGILLIPALGLIGAAISALSAYMMVPLVIYYIAKKYFSFNIEWRRLCILLIISFPSLVYGFFEQYFNDIGFVTRVFVFSITLAIIFIKFFSNEEHKKIKYFIKNILIKKLTI